MLKAWRDKRYNKCRRFEIMENCSLSRHFPFPLHLVYKQNDDPADDRPPPCGFSLQCLPLPEKAFYVDVHESFVTEPAFTSIFLVVLRHPTPFVGSIEKIYLELSTCRTTKKKTQVIPDSGFHQTFIVCTLLAREIKSPRLCRTCKIGHLSSIRSPSSLF